MVTPIIDAHSHIGQTIASGEGQTTSEWLKRMDSCGIDQAIISVAAGGIQSEGISDTRRFNEVIAAAVVDAPDRFPIGLASIEVRHGDAALDEVRRAREELGLKGLVFHATFEGFFVDSEPFFKVMDALGKDPALVLIHSAPSGAANPGAIGKVAERYPHLTIQMGHPVFTEDQRVKAVEIARKHSNLFIDVAYQGDPEIVEFFVRELGAERVLFGSDAPYFDPEVVLKAVRAARISDADRNSVLSGNASRLISSVR